MIIGATVNLENWVNELYFANIETNFEQSKINKDNLQFYYLEQIQIHLGLKK